MVFLETNLYIWGAVLHRKDMLGGLYGTNLYIWGAVLHRKDLFVGLYGKEFVDRRLLAHFDLDQRYETFVQKTTCSCISLLRPVLFHAGNACRFSGTCCCLHGKGSAL